MRIACLNAFKHVPPVERKAAGDESTVSTLLWLALYDPDQVCNRACSLAFSCCILLVLV